MKALLDRLADGEILVSDGAMGTLLHAHKLGLGECPESWSISRPDVVKGIAQAYIDAGADIVQTNSFGANSLKLASYRLSDKAREFNLAAARLAREAMGDRGHVAASVGPTGHFAREKGGKVPLAAFYDSFAEQIVALRDGGADAICIETMFSRLEAEQAIRAAKENTALPVICTFAFEIGKKGFRTMDGVTPEQAATAAAAAGADVIGSNCGCGVEDMIDIVKLMKAAVPDRPILVHANAGMPAVENGATVYRETPQSMATRVPELIAAGAAIVGGCCGTTPEHIAAIVRTVRSRGDSSAAFTL